MPPDLPDNPEERDSFFAKYDHDEALQAFDLVADEQGQLPAELASFQEAYDQLNQQRPADDPEREILALRKALFRVTPRILITPSLVTINVVVFLGMLVSGISFWNPGVTDLLVWGANHGPLTLHGESWRLFTSTFLHIGALHIALNMYVLWQVGRILERLTGNTGFLILYVASGLIASLASVYVKPGVISAGASGAVFGSFGALLGFIWRDRDRSLRLLKPLLRGITKIVLLNLIIGLLIPQIDMAAHVGGLLMGLLLGLLMARPVLSSTPKDIWMRNALAGGFSLLLIAAGFYWAPAQKAALFQLHRDINVLADQTNLWSSDFRDNFKQATKDLDPAGIEDHFTAFNETLDKRMLPRWKALRARAVALQQSRQTDRALFTNDVDDLTSTIELIDRNIESLQKKRLPENLVPDPLPEETVVPSPPAKWHLTRRSLEFT